MGIGAPPEAALLVAFCTMNRERDLRTAFASVVADIDGGGGDAAIGILIVDDGDLAAEVAYYEGECGRRGIPFRYHRKAAAARGLYESRRKAIEMCRSPLILFLDDDAEIGPGYIGRMVERFRGAPDIVGLGGVDSISLPPAASRLARRYMEFFALCGGGAGELSPSGLNYSQAFWRSQVVSFQTQFLHGCNMSFRTSVLSDLPDLPWLAGHAPCEDLVLSVWASRKGFLVVDTGLPIRHHEAAGGRGDVAARLKRKLVNHREFLRLARGRVPVVFWWSVVGMFLKDAALAARGRHGAHGVYSVLRAYGANLVNPSA